MGYVSIKSKYHIAIDGQGLILQGAPNRLAYQQGQAPIYGNRFASGDRDYNDLSQWWYFAQTSWAAGFKDIISWLDDAKYYCATNIDTWSENGSIKLTRKPVIHNDFTEPLICGAEIDINGTIRKYVGTSDGASNKPLIYEYNGTTWTDIIATQMTTNQNVISQISGRVGIMWISTVGVGNLNVVLTWTGSAFTDQSANIYNAGATISFQPKSSRCHLHYQGTTYVFVDDYISDKYALVKTTASNPSVAGDWSKVFEIAATDGTPVSCEVYNGLLYYIVNKANACELHAWSIANSVDVLVATFKNSLITNWGVGDNLLKVLNGKLIITIPLNEIWQIDGSILTRIFVKDEYKKTLNQEVNADLSVGCILADNKAWWGNLIYDGSYFHNTWKEVSDAAAEIFYPLFIDSNGIIYGNDSVDNSKLYSITLTGASYKGNADKNYIIFNNFDKISGVDKMAYSVTVIFKSFISGQSIIVEYLLGELTSSSSWTVLGTASFALDGGSVADKTFYFPIATIFKKIWFRVKLASGGSDTPTLNDLVMEYLPVPTFKKTWALNVNCGDEVRRLDGALVDLVGRELKGRLERAWWTKSVLDFQDLDYASTAVNDASFEAGDTTITVDSTADFPEQGRIRIDDEEITYTGKTPTTFTGCARGARDTRAAAHADDSVVNNAYKVIITELSSRVPIVAEDRELEYSIAIALREV